jgi:hypothetical protein
MANVKITDLPAAQALNGTELVPIVQQGVTVRTTTNSIAAVPSQTQTFITVNNEPSLLNSRQLSTQTGLTLVDGGAQSTLIVMLNGASSSLESAGNGILVKTNSTTITPRSIVTSGDGLSITNGDGQSGNPSLALSGIVSSLSLLSGAGFVVSTGSGTVTPRTITGTASQISVSNGTGASANPVLSLSDNPIIPGSSYTKITVGGTASRPALPLFGMVRANSDTSEIEIYNGSNWVNLTTGLSATRYYGSFYDTTTQTIASTTTEYPINIGVNAESNGVSIVSSNRITFANAGVYNIQFSAQLVSSDTAIHEVTIWLKLNGTNVPYSAGMVSVPNRHAGINGAIIATWNYVMTLAANDYLQLYWMAESTNISMNTLPAGTTPTTPVSPSIILTATLV